MLRLKIDLRALKQVRAKNITDALFFTLRGVCRETAKTSFDRVGETRSGLSPRDVALARSMVGKY